MSIKKIVIIGMEIFTMAMVLLSCNLVVDSPSDTELSGKERKLPNNMVYSFNCLEKDSGSLSGILGKADNIIGKVATFNIEVSDQDQVAFGEQFLKEAVKDKNFVIDSTGPVNGKLNTILNELLRKRVKPTDIIYKVYLLDDTATINAYTVGGKIFVTKAIIKKCKNDDQLYAIIGHEIGHNEKGHIKNGIKAMKASKRFFGEWGDMFFMAKKLLTGSFNQKNELEADYYGLDLAWKLGYDICAVPAFWNDMARAEEHDDAAFDFLRTHPYSDVRSRCLVNHILTNFKEACK
ncbi:MAG: M48 family metallopeptidase [Ferruginibacter sp.]